MRDHAAGTLNHVQRAATRTSTFARRHTIELVVSTLVLLFLIVFFASRIFYVVPPGHVGVLYRPFSGGTDLRAVIPEGFHVIVPWDHVYMYDVRLQLQDENLDVLSVDGLRLQLNVAYRYALIPQNVPELHEYVGPDYAKVLIAPEVAANARDVLSANTPDEIYAGRRVEVQQQILQRVQQHLLSHFNPAGVDHPIRWLQMEDVLIRSITLPPAVEAAINDKNEQEQLNQEYDYRLLREAKESERKRIEALGIREFQDTVSQGITPSYLRWEGIQATLELAKSNNAKVVIIGSGQGGLPLILGNMDSGVGPQPKATVSPGPLQPGLLGVEQEMGLSVPPGRSSSPPPPRR